MIIFKSYLIYSPTREKVTASKHYNLKGSLCEKHVTQLEIEGRTFSLTVPTLGVECQTEDLWLNVPMLRAECWHEKPKVLGSIPSCVTFFTQIAC